MRSFRAALRPKSHGDRHKDHHTAKREDEWVHGLEGFLAGDASLLLLKGGVSADKNPCENPYEREKENAEDEPREREATDAHRHEFWGEIVCKRHREKKHAKNRSDRKRKPQLTTHQAPEKFFAVDIHSRQNLLGPAVFENLFVKSYSTRRGQSLNLNLLALVVFQISRFVRIQERYYATPMIAMCHHLKGNPRIIPVSQP